MAFETHSLDADLQVEMPEDALADPVDLSERISGKAASLRSEIRGLKAQIYAGGGLKDILDEYHVELEVDRSLSESSLDTYARVLGTDVPRIEDYVDLEFIQEMQEAEVPSLDEGGLSSGNTELGDKFELESPIEAGQKESELDKGKNNLGLANTELESLVSFKREQQLKAYNEALKVYNSTMLDSMSVLLGLDADVENLDFEANKALAKAQSDGIMSTLETNTGMENDWLREMALEIPGVNQDVLETLAESELRTVFSSLKESLHLNRARVDSLLTGARSKREVAEVFDTYYGDSFRFSSGVAKYEPNALDRGVVVKDIQDYLTWRLPALNELLDLELDLEMIDPQGTLHIKEYLSIQEGVSSVREGILAGGRNERDLHNLELRIEHLQESIEWGMLDFYTLAQEVDFLHLPEIGSIDVYDEKNVVGLVLAQILENKDDSWDMSPLLEVDNLGIAELSSFIRNVILLNPDEEERSEAVSDSVIADVAAAGVNLDSDSGVDPAIANVGDRMLGPSTKAKEAVEAVAETVQEVQEDDKSEPEDSLGGLEGEIESGDSEETEARSSLEFATNRSSKFWQNNFASLEDGYTPYRSLNGELTAETLEAEYKDLYFQYLDLQENGNTKEMDIERVERALNYIDSTYFAPVDVSGRLLTEYEALLRNERDAQREMYLNEVAR